jgi:hypothetical protein
LEDALADWHTEYYNYGENGPLTEAGQALYHLGMIALNAHLRELYTAAGSK